MCGSPGSQRRARSLLVPRHSAALLQVRCASALPRDQMCVSLTCGGAWPVNVRPTRSQPTTRLELIVVFLAHCSMHCTRRHGRMSCVCACTVHAVNKMSVRYHVHTHAHACNRRNILACIYSTGVHEGAEGGHASFYCANPP